LRHEYNGIHPEYNTQKNCAISKIERWPVIIANMNINKINHTFKPDTVNDVAHRSARNQTRRTPLQRIQLIQRKKEPEHYEKCQNRNNKLDYHLLIPEKTKADPAIPNRGQIQKRGKNELPVWQEDQIQHPVLCQLIKNNREPTSA
tara:strand:- start:1308 stop:1745 length:438 start_codon:yes stop_codon:yes gene_type:complete